MAGAAMLEDAQFLSPSACGVGGIVALELAAKHRVNVLALARMVVIKRRLSDGELGEALRRAGLEAEV